MLRENTAEQTAEADATKISYQMHVMPCAVSDESSVTQALPSCLSFFFLLLHLLPHVSAPLGEYEYTISFQSEAADEDATWHDALITLLRNVGTAIRAGLQATDGADIQIRLQCWRMFSAPT
jgi:hypothetical protein